MEVKNQKKAWLYLLPVLIVLAVFTFYPIIMSFVWAFLEGYRLNTPISGVGIQNFIEIFKAEDVIIGNNFLRALQNTAIIAFVTVPCSTILALLISVALNSIKPLQKALQTIYFLPYITNTLAIGAVFALIFSNPTQTSGGIVNDILKMMGLSQIHWTDGSNYPASLALVCIYDIWSGLPFKILIILGALQSVNKQCYEAAKIDGTPRRRVLWRITVPLISPPLSYLLITGFIGAFKEYNSIIGLFSTGGEKTPKMGANNFMLTIVGIVYQYIDAGTATQIGNYGVAAAGALVLFAIIMVLTSINLYVSKKKVHY